jgi:hypothetical protein
MDAWQEIRNSCVTLVRKASNWSLQAGQLRRLVR